MSPFPNVSSALAGVERQEQPAAPVARQQRAVLPRTGLESSEDWARIEPTSFAVELAGGATLGGVRPPLLLDLPNPGAIDGLGVEEFDVAPDGGFLVLKGLPQKPPVPHVIVMVRRVEAGRAC